jgi:hypothetical protein
MKTHASDRRRARRLLAGAAGVVVAWFVTSVPAPAQSGSVPPTREVRLAAIGGLQEGLVPLFVLGDVNEDGRVDAQDLALVRALAEATAHGGTLPAAATCPAAGDFDMSTRVDSRDVAQLAAILKAGRVVQAALAWQPRVPCSFAWFRVATRPDAEPGEAVPVRFLRPGMTAATCKVTVRDGAASVEASKDGLGYVVNVAENAKPGSMVTLLLRLGQDGEYLYSLAITPIPPR